MIYFRNLILEKIKWLEKFLIDIKRIGLLLLNIGDKKDLE